MPTPRQGYKIDGKKVPSVTTILGDDVGGLLWWAEKGAAECTSEVGGDAATGHAEWRARKKDTMDAGTYAHWLIATTLGKEEIEPDVSLVARERGAAAYRNWVDWGACAGLEIVAVEERVTCKEFSFGGTPDLVVRDSDGGLWVYDWKTAEKPKLRSKSVVQAAAYMLALLESGYDKPAGLRIVGIPTVVGQPVLDRSFPWDPVGIHAASYFGSRRVMFELGKELDAMLDDD